MRPLGETRAKESEEGKRKADPPLCTNPSDTLTLVQMHLKELGWLIDLQLALWGKFMVHTGELDLVVVKSTSLLPHTHTHF